MGTNELILEAKFGDDRLFSFGYSATTLYKLYKEKKNTTKTVPVFVLQLREIFGQNQSFWQYDKFILKTIKIDVK